MPTDIQSVMKEFQSWPAARKLAAIRGMSPDKRNRLLLYANQHGIDIPTDSAPAPAPRASGLSLVGDYLGAPLVGTGEGLAALGEGTISTVGALAHPVRSAEGIFNYGKNLYNAAKSGVREAETPGLTVPQRAASVVEPIVARLPITSQMVAHSRPGYFDASPKAVEGAFEGATMLELPKAAAKIIPGSLAEARRMASPRAPLRSILGTGPRSTGDLVDATRLKNLKIDEENSIGAEKGRERDAAEKVTTAKVRNLQHAVKKKMGQKYAEVDNAMTDVRVPRSEIDSLADGVAERFGSGSRDVKGAISSDLHSVIGEPDPEVEAELNEKTAAAIPDMPGLTFSEVARSPYLISQYELNYGDGSYADDEASLKNSAFTASGLRHLVSRLGRESNFDSLHHNAIEGARAALRGRIQDYLQDQADAAGVGPENIAANQYARQYYETFTNKDAPLRPFLSAPYGLSRAAASIGDSSKEAVEALNRYDPDTARAYQNLQAREHLARAFKADAGEKPHETISASDIETNHATHLNRALQTIGSVGKWGGLYTAVRGAIDSLATGRGEEYMAGGFGVFLGSLALRRILGSSMFRRFLTEATAADIREIPLALRGPMAGMAIEGEKAGIKLSPAARRLAGSAPVAASPQPAPRSVAQGMSQ